MASRNIFRHFFRANVFQICIFSFLKNTLVQINSKLNSKPYDYLYKYLMILFLHFLLNQLQFLLSCNKHLRECQTTFTLNTFHFISLSGVFFFKCDITHYLLFDIYYFLPTSTIVKLACSHIYCVTHTPPMHFFNCFPLGASAQRD